MSSATCRVPLFLSLASALSSVGWPQMGDARGAEIGCGEERPMIGANYQSTTRMDMEVDWLGRLASEWGFFQDAFQMIGTDICTRRWAKRLRFERFRCGWLVSRGALLVVGGAGAHCME